MSFLGNNEHFIRHFKSTLKGLDDDQRRSRFINEFRTDARRRMSVAYANLGDGLAAKLEFYEDVLSVFGALESDQLLRNIYFEREADELFDGLRTVIEGIGRMNNIFDPIIGRMVDPYKGSHIKGYLRNFFITTIDLSDADWEIEDQGNNPLINQLAKWLVESLNATEPNVKAVERVLVHYTKLWNIYFCEPYEYKKGFVLFHKVLEHYKKLGPEMIRMDLHGCILRSRDVIADLFPLIYHSPLTDIDDRSFYLADSKTPFPVNAKIYPEKNRAFHKVFSDDQFLFKDLSAQNWNSLIKGYCDTPERYRSVYLNELAKRKHLGLVPDAREIAELVRQKAELINSAPDIGRILNDIIHENYIFYF